LGKIKKIKSERKKARVEAEIKRKKMINNSFKYSILFLVIISIFVAGFFGFKQLDTKYNLSDQFRGVFRQTQDSSSIQGSEEIVKRKTYNTVPEMEIDLNKEYIAEVETSKGNFKIKLFVKDAPRTVNNFVVLSRDGFYNGLTFHRIIKDFMIQGGDPEGTGSGGPGYSFEDEFNDRKLVRGSLAMANSGPDTNGSQFFIVTAGATDWLDGKHTNFGEVIEGMDVVMAIQGAETDEGDRPKSAVTINKITIEEK